jgi:hypothetical protein
MGQNFDVSILVLKAAPQAWRYDIVKCRGNWDGDMMHPVQNWKPMNTGLNAPGILLANMYTILYGLPMPIISTTVA